MDLCHGSYSLFKKIFAVANAKTLAFERRIGNVKHQFSQLVRGALAENKLVTANCACVRAISSLRSATRYSASLSGSRRNNANKCRNLFGP
jgi:hypothetical protein